jgi:tetratricopeptide (TPR) repeat protein
MRRTSSRYPAVLASAAFVLLSACAGTTTVTGADAPGAASTAASATGATGATGGAEGVDPTVRVEAARKAVDAKPDDPDRWFELGLAWQARADASGASAPAFRDSARVAYEELLERDPDNVRGLVHHGLILEDLQRPEDALTAYQRAVELAPEDPRPYINLGSLEYFQFHRTFAAKEALSKAIELEPKSPDAHFNLGVLFADANLFGEARTEWQRVVELDSDGPAGQLARENLERIAPLLKAQDAASAAQEEASP